MIPFLALRALGWNRPPVPAKTPASARLSDPVGDAIMSGLVLARLWSLDMGQALTRDGRRLGVRIHLPEAQQGDRHVDRQTAEDIRRNVLATLAERHTIRFHDVLFCERGPKGWEVVIRAEERG